MDDAGVQWSELPPELWSKVGKYLHSPIDAVRFRSVCRSWRSSVPPFPLTSPPLRLRFPVPNLPATIGGSTVDAFLSESTVYRHAPLGHQPNLNRKGSLVKLEKSEHGKMRYLHPLSNRIIRNPKSLSKGWKDWNLLDLRIDEVARSYSLKLSDKFSVLGIAKLVVFPNPTDVDDVVRDCIAIAVWDKGMLGFARSGDDKWSLIDEQNFHYDDVIVYNRQIYAVNRWGTVFWIDSSMRLLQFSPPLIGFGHRKHLVECGGELLVIDRFLDEAIPIPNPIGWPYNSSPKAVGFKAHKLDQEWGRWVELKNLENRSIVLGSGGCCFSVDSRDFKGCEGNCIYYCDLNDNVVSRSCFGRVFDLEGGRIGNILGYPGVIGIFCPAPIWLSNSFLP